MKPRENHSYLIVSEKERKDHKRFTWMNKGSSFASLSHLFKPLSTGNFENIVRRLPMTADGSESKLCIGRRNSFNRLVIDSRDWNYQIVHVTIGHISDFSKSTSAVVEESTLEHRLSNCSRHSDIIKHQCFLYSGGSLLSSEIVRLCPNYLHFQAILRICSG